MDCQLLFLYKKKKKEYKKSKTDPTLPRIFRPVTLNTHIFYLAQLKKLGTLPSIVYHIKPLACHNDNRKLNNRKTYKISFKYWVKGIDRAWS